MTVSIFQSIHQIGAQKWKRVESPDFPFTDFEFLSALEDSNCIGASSGWIPLYFVDESKDSKINAVWIQYLKTNSQGEYIFDHDWAHAYHSQGVKYFPKMLSAIPFTPATGSKVLFAPHLSSRERIDIFNQLDLNASEFSRDNSCSSQHHLFIREDEHPSFSACGYQIRKTFQFHWKNKGYSSFEEFIDSFIGKKRKNILKERREVQKEVTTNSLSGDELNENHARSMHLFYSSTIRKMGAIPYLNQDFFLRVFQNMKDRILLNTASIDEEVVASSICFKKGKNLYGRYWGCRKEVKHLHFELCYYLPLDHSIANGLELFEAGAQGGHKWQRGFLPVATYSAHKFQSSAFQTAIDRYLEKERIAMTEELKKAEKYSPFKQVPH